MSRTLMMTLVGLCCAGTAMAADIGLQHGSLGMGPDS